MKTLGLHGWQPRGRLLKIIEITMSYQTQSHENIRVAWLVSMRKVAENNRNYNSKTKLRAMKTLGFHGWQPRGRLLKIIEITISYQTQSHENIRVAWLATTRKVAENNRDYNVIPNSEP